MRKTKVAFFSDILLEGFDGAQRTMFHIINRIPRDRYEYCFICGEGPGENFDYEVLDVPRITIPFNTNYSMAIPILAYGKMKKALDNFRPDVIHIASPSWLGNFAIDYATERSIPIISIYHTHFISYVDYYLKSLALIKELARSSIVTGQRNFYNKCDLILVPTPEIKEELTSLGFIEEKMVIWKRGLDHEVFNRSKKDVNYIQKITNNQYPNILFASRLVWEKNLKLLIQLYRMLQDRGDLVNFIVAGEGPARETLENEMPGAFFTGKLNQQELSILYASADVFVFPSVSETFGSVVVEAMACGCPCVIANGGGSQSFIEQGVNGFLCEADDAEDFYKMITRVIENESIRKGIIEEGYQYTKSLDWDNLVIDYFNFIDQLAEKVVFLQQEL